MWVGNDIMMNLEEIGCGVRTGLVSLRIRTVRGHYKLFSSFRILGNFCVVAQLFKFALQNK